MIKFDEHVVLELQSEIRKTIDVLDSSALSRNNLVCEAMNDFAGPYANRFAQLANSMKTDQVRLARVLEDLSDDVGKAIDSARLEKIVCLIIILMRSSSVGVLIILLTCTSLVCF